MACHSIPPVANRSLDAFPGRLAAVLVLVPVTLQIGLDVLPLAPLELVRCLESIPVARLIVRVIVRAGIRPRTVVVSPVRIFVVPVRRIAAFCHRCPPLVDRAVRWLVATCAPALQLG